MISASIERAQAEEPFPIRHGVFVAVVGPSGGGKDSVINYARERLGTLASDVIFTRRVITRPMDPDGEEHDTLDEAGFERQREAGRFAVSWHANGLYYGLPVILDHAMRAGRVVVANGSRGIVRELRERYASVSPVVVTAPPEILAKRLAQRGRETPEEVLARLSRASAHELTVQDALVIDNSGRLEEAGERFLQVLRKAAAWSDLCDTV